MLKLNASYSKKVPVENEYSSQSYHASIEVEIPDGLSPDQLKGRIHETFELVRKSVECELHVNGNTSRQQRNEQNAPVGKPSRPPENQSRQQEASASAKQIRYLLDLSRENGISLHELSARLNLRNIQQLTRTQCSQRIDEINGKVA